MFTNLGLVAYAECMCNYGSPYWYGTYGNIASEELYQAKKKQYKDQYEKWSKYSFESQYGMKVHDCIGLEKGYKMNPTLDEDGYVKDPLKPSVYNSKYDYSADGSYARAKEKGSISTIPEIKGVLVWKKGHVGVYIGKGWVIEERGHTYGTVKTRISDRPWTNWFKDPDIQYVETPQPTPNPKGDTCMIELPVLKKGDKSETVKSLQILLNGKRYYDSDGLPLNVDGSFGKRTEQSVKKFQTKNSLSVDGVVGKSTWTKLIEG